MELRKCDKSFDDFELEHYKRWLLNNGHSSREDVLQYSWVTSDEREESIQAWNEGKVE